MLDLLWRERCGDTLGEPGRQSDHAAANVARADLHRHVPGELGEVDDPAFDARGALVVTADVLAALHSGKLSGAGLDTFDREPSDAAALSGISNLIATPHSGYYSVEAVSEPKHKVAIQIAKFFRVLYRARPDLRLSSGLATRRP